MMLDLLDPATLGRLIGIISLMIIGAAVGYAKGHKDGYREGFVRGKAVAKAHKKIAAIVEKTKAVK